jgi:hypothetical protein
VDEIIKKETFEKAISIFNEDKTATYAHGLRPLIQWNTYLYAYKMNLLHIHWTQHHTGLLTEFSNFKKILPATMRHVGITTHPVIPDGGWHFTFLDNTDGDLVLDKQRSWAHSKDIYPGQKTKFDHTTKEEAVARFFHDYAITKVDITEATHPKYIIDNLEKFDNCIYKD